MGAFLVDIYLQLIYTYTQIGMSIYVLLTQCVFGEWDTHNVLLL